MKRDLVIICLWMLPLLSCSLEDKHREAKIKRQNQTGEIIERKEGERRFLAERPKPSTLPRYPWSNRFEKGAKISLNDDKETSTP
ncbi:hypothetical protein [Estrella lausannensis]|uniref:Uncharacterized protein n=1 Tax=Estrella lausannensis TaxID=483423 RepID=A0A0H5DQ95_9BACT|nr:hypothetical protein [Estrella lausannensis]CRX38811.1 hypothetical protein ELAC_1479 [Estrella lausannensis]